MKKFRILLPVVVALAALLPTLQVYAQTPTEPPPPPPGPSAPEIYSREELTQLLAPIALYPDPLLSQVLMASTYPLEIVEADRWLRKHPRLKREALDAALQGQDWDPSVKSICHYPTVLAEMDKNLARTTRLGNAFLAQQNDIMNIIQELRHKARDQGALADSSQQRVVVRDTAVIIEPAVPDMVYVPYYNPLVVYGPWWYPAYPPFVWFPGIGISVGIGFSPGFYVGPAVIGWSYFNWPAFAIGVNYGLAAPFVGVGYVGRGVVAGGAWAHDPVHRRGVAYANAVTARRFGQAAGVGAPSSAARGFAVGARPGAAPGAAAAGGAAAGVRPGAVPGAAAAGVRAGARAGAVSPAGPAARPGGVSGAAAGVRLGPSLSPFAGSGGHGGAFSSSASQRGAASGGSLPGRGGGFTGGGPSFGHGGGGFGGGGHHR